MEAGAKPPGSEAGGRSCRVPAQGANAVLEASALEALARAFERGGVEQGPGAPIEHAEAEAELIEAALGEAPVTRPGGAS